MTETPSSSIVIVGGGLSGTLVAVQLLSRARKATRITIVDASDRVGEGVAFRTRHPDHFLNVRAKSMSAMAGDREHFVRWLSGDGREAAERWNAEPDPEAFLPRGLYAEYVAAILEAARVGAAQGVVLERICGDVIAVEPRAGGASVTLNGGRSLDATAVVLALGNAPPAHPIHQLDHFYRSERYVRDPWSAGALNGIGVDSPVLIVGSGLTMVDVVVALSRAGHRGPMVAVSRHGLLPREHRSVSTAAEFLDPRRPPATIRALVHAVRERIRSAAREGGDWRSSFDTLRPDVSSFWLALPATEQRRFLRHVRPYWDVHRHRAAPANMRDVEALRSSGRLVVRAARIRAFQDAGPMVEVTFLPRGQNRTETLRVERVINATGPDANYQANGSPLVRHLFERGLVRPGPFGLGFDATPEGVLIDSAGNQSRILFTLGPPLRGVLWETTAVPEIREQAGALAERLLAT